MKHPKRLLSIVPLVLLVAAAAGCDTQESTRPSTGNSDSPSISQSDSSSSSSSQNSSSSSSSSVNSSTSTGPASSDSSSSSSDIEDPREYFLEAREKTVNGPGWTYEDRLSITTTINYALGTISGPSGTRTGTTRYSTSGDVGFYQNFESSGALLFDGQTHAIRRGTTLETIKQNEDGEVTSYETEQVDADYKYDTSTYAKAIFEYEDSDIKDVTAVSINRYEITTGWNASQIISTLLNNLNNPIVEQIIENIPETQSDVHFYVTFTDDGYIDTFEYDFTVSVEVLGHDQTLEFNYSMDFTGYTAQDIEVPSFDGVLLTEEQVANAVEGINDAADRYRSLTNSAYNFELNTDIDYGSWWQIGASPSVSVKGSTKRQVTVDDVFFLNDLAVDISGYEAGEDYERIRGKTSDGKVWDVQERFIVSDIITEVTGDTVLDEFYLLPDEAFLAADSFRAGQTETADGVTTVTLGISDAGVVSFMELIDDAVRTDATLENEWSIWANDGAEWTVSDLEDSNISISYDSTGIVSLDIEITGNIDTQIDDYSDETSFEITLTIETTDAGEGYEAPDSEEDLANLV